MSHRSTKARRPRCRRVPIALTIAAAALALAPSAALAAPRVTGVTGFYGPDGEFGDYVSFRVQTSDASSVFLDWHRHGGACARTARRTRCLAARRRSIAEANFGFRNCRRTRRRACAGPARFFRIRLTACNRSGCRSRVFEGRFREQ